MGGPSCQLALNMNFEELQHVCKFETYVYIRIRSFNLHFHMATCEQASKPTYTHILQYIPASVELTQVHSN